jgi:hypothetical protein
MPRRPLLGVGLKRPKSQDFCSRCVSECSYRAAVTCKSMMATVPAVPFELPSHNRLAVLPPDLGLAGWLRLMLAAQHRAPLPVTELLVDLRLAGPIDLQGDSIGMAREAVPSIWQTIQWLLQCLEVQKRLHIDGLDLPQGARLGVSLVRADSAYVELACTGYRSAPTHLLYAERFEIASAATAGTPGGIVCPGLAMPAFNTSLLSPAFRRTTPSLGAASVTWRGVLRA